MNYTQHTSTQVFERDSFTQNETAVADAVMCGAVGPAPDSPWQATYFKDRWGEMKQGAQEQPHAWEFSDCPNDDPQFRYKLQVLVPRAP